MTKMSCPACGLAVSFRNDEPLDSSEHCPRCLAKSRGALSIRLKPGAPPAHASPERRVIDFLRRHASRPLGA